MEGVKQPRLVCSLVVVVHAIWSLSMNLCKPVAVSERRLRSYNGLVACGFITAGLKRSRERECAELRTKRQIAES